MTEMDAGKMMALMTVVAMGQVLIACGTHNVGEQLLPGIPPQVSVSVPGDLRGGEQATWQVRWLEGSPPYSVTLDLGGGGWEDVDEAAAVGGPLNHETWMVNDSITTAAAYTYIATVTDAAGASGTASGSYSVAPLIPLLEITDLSHSGQGLLAFSIESNDPEWPAVAVSAGDGIAVPEPADESYEPPYMPTIEQPRPPGVSSWDYMVYLSPLDVIDGCSGTVTVNAADSWGNAAEQSIDITLPGLYEIPFHSLAAIPLEAQARIGEEVTVVVASGDFPPDQPFSFMNGVGVTVNVGADYADETWNIGAPGGNQKDNDGVWGKMSPAPGSYLLPSGGLMIVPTPVDGNPDLHFIGLNVTPIGGGEVTVGGALINFALTFEVARTYGLGFIEFQDCKRTYYSESDSTEHGWADISNNLPGVPNTITVTE